MVAIRPLPSAAPPERRQSFGSRGPIDSDLRNNNGSGLYTRFTRKLSGSSSQPDAQALAAARNISALEQHQATTANRDSVVDPFARQPAVPRRQPQNIESFDIVQQKQNKGLQRKGSLLNKLRGSSDQDRPSASSDREDRHHNGECLSESHRAKLVATTTQARARACPQQKKVSSCLLSFECALDWCRCANRLSKSAQPPWNRPNQVAKGSERFDRLPAERYSFSFESHCRTDFRTSQRRAHEQRSGPRRPLPGSDQAPAKEVADFAAPKLFRSHCSRSICLQKHLRVANERCDAER